MKLKTLIISLFFTLSALSAVAQIMPRFGQSRSGTAGFQFIKINVDPRSAAMGNSAVAILNDGAAMYWNPALAAESPQSQLFTSYSRYFLDINMNYVGYMHRFKSFAIGGSMQYMDSGDIMETTEFQPLGTGRTFRTAHLAVGLTLAQKLTELFSYGLTIKFLNENIEEIQSRAAAIDFGFFYRVGETGLRFAVALQNFGLDASPTGETTRLGLPTEEHPDGVIVESDLEDITPPTTFVLGASYDAYESENFDVVLTGQITNPSDNAERISFGTEITFIDRFFLRTGYQLGIEESVLPSFGAGILVPVAKTRTLAVDYSFTSLELLGTTHRIGLKIGL